MTAQLQKPDSLFDRVASILEQARSHVVKSVNSNTIIAYWLIGREIVEEIQSGEERAEYGKHVLEQLSIQLTKKYGKGFSVANLKNFRQFYQVFQTRLIRHPLGSEFPDDPKSYPVGSESEVDVNLQLNSLSNEDTVYSGFFAQ